jgi:hypothetical protein
LDTYPESSGSFELIDLQMTNKPTHTESEIDSDKVRFTLHRHLTPGSWNTPKMKSWIVPQLAYMVGTS